MSETPATDDAPFPYLRERTIPTFYLLAVALILGVSLLLVRVVSGPIGRMSPYLDLFFMGAAFLLLETKSVVQFALLFGTTWFVNALVFGGVLLSVLAAIEVARRWRPARPALHRDSGCFRWYQWRRVSFQRAADGRRPRVLVLANKDAREPFGITEWLLRRSCTKLRRLDIHSRP